MIRILVFGDSIARGDCDNKGGWVQRLKNSFYEKDISVYNLSISGDKTSGVLERFEFETKQRLHTEKELLILFAIGINDSQFKHDQNLNSVLKKDFEKNIAELISLAKKYSLKTVFVGLTPVDESRTTPIPWNTKKSYTNEYIKEYDESIQLACKKNNLHFIELINEFMKKNYEKLLEDGLHPNSAGHELMFEIIKNYLLRNKLI